jgi:sec-independent protein translocase protein TatB
MPDILFILLLAMIVLGPKKLPQVAAQVGKYLSQFQRVKREVLEQMNAEVLRLEKGKEQQG